MAAEPLKVLEVHVSEKDGVSRYSYKLVRSDKTEHGPLTQEHTVEVNQQLVRDLCQEIDEALKGALSGEPGHHDKLVANGQTLYSHLFRPVQGTDELALMVEVRESPGPMLVRSNEMLVPWELLHDGREFLGLAYDLGQGSVVSGPFRMGRDIGRLEQVLIVGDPLGDLPAARREAERIAEWLRARGTRCELLLGEQATLANVVTKLSSTQYDLLHYCGHVTIRSRPADSGLLLHRRSLLNESALMTASRIGAPPVVFVNGCRAVGPIANLCVSFMTMGAKVVIGTRAEVAEESAQRFAEEFYRRLLDDQTAGAAIREARRSVLDERDGAWASFLLYGNPGVHITGGRGVPVRPQALGPGPYSPAAAAMMDRVHAVARGRGVVISLDLLFGLVTCPELRPFIERSIGVDGLAALTQMLHGFGGVMPDAEGHHRSANGREPEVQLSDTVHATLIKATGIASAEGRSVVTPRDIAAAFTEIGGGSSGQILELFGVSLRQLMSANAAPGRVRGAGARSSPDVAATLFDQDGSLRADVLDDPAATAVRAALLLAAAKRAPIGTHTFLQGFALAGSEVLREALEQQGDVGRQAVQRLFSPTPRRADFSQRSLTALDRAREPGAGAPAGEAALLLALLHDEGSAARQLLDKLGIDSERLVQDLERSG
ncbi:CHAT domain-containing protein [Saccharothrix xinjiangensis]|uniref:CHAT domain-containing protein n=1 Tax=Saccharothrix xinjiangensis TaxID=204798 RepID=A0ABV9XSR5_9PSEU